MVRERSPSVHRRGAARRSTRPARGPRPRSSRTGGGAACAGSPASHPRDRGPGRAPWSARRSARGSGGDALRRLASELSGTPDLAQLFDEVLDDSIRLFDADRVGLWLWDAGREAPARARRVAEPPRRSSSPMSMACPRAPRRAGLRAMRSGTVLDLPRCLRPRHHARAARHLRPERRRGDLLRADRVPRRTPGAHRPLPPPAVRLDGGRSVAGAELRRRHRHRARQRATRRIGQQPCGPAPRRPGPGVAAERPAGRPRDRRGDRRRGRLADHLRHDPHLSP